MLCPVERHQHPSAQALKRRERAAPANVCSALTNSSSNAGRMRRRASAGYSCPSGWRICRTASRSSTGHALAPGPLMRQERRAPHEKYGERREADVGHRIGASLGRSLALVRQTGADHLQIRDQTLKRAHAFVKSHHRARRNHMSWAAHQKNTTCGKWDSVPGRLFAPHRNPERQSQMRMQARTHSDCELLKVRARHRHAVRFRGRIAERRVRGTVRSGGCSVLVASTGRYRGWNPCRGDKASMETSRVTRTDSECEPGRQSRHVERDFRRQARQPRLAGEPRRAGGQCLRAYSPRHRSCRRNRRRHHQDHLG